MSDQQNTQDQLSGAMANASLNGDQSKQQQQQQQQQQQNYYNPNAAQSFVPQGGYQQFQQFQPQQQQQQYGGYNQYNQYQGGYQQNYNNRGDTNKVITTEVDTSKTTITVVAIKDITKTNNMEDISNTIRNLNNNSNNNLKVCRWQISKTKTEQQASLNKPAVKKTLKLAGSSGIKLANATKKVDTTSKPQSKESSPAPAPAASASSAQEEKKEEKEAAATLLP